MITAALAVVLIAMLTVLSIVVCWPHLARRAEPALLPAYRAAALAIVATAYLITLAAITAAALR